MDLNTGKLVKESQNVRYTIYKIKEIEKFTELLNLPCVLSEEPSELQEFKQTKKKSMY